MCASNPRRLLLVTYEFPPSAGGGNQRLAKFAKYLPRHGWDVTVVCAEPVQGRPRDDSLLADVSSAHVVRLPARHVAVGIASALAPLKRSLFKGGRGRGGGTSGNGSNGNGVPLSTRLARWVSVPDPAALWGRSVPGVAARLHGGTPFDAVMASGPPYSALVAGARIGRALGVPFVADMRDAWHGNPGSAWPTRLHSRRSLRLERAVVSQADTVLAVSSVIGKEAGEFGACRVEVVPNGFDPVDMPEHTPNGPGPLNVAFMGRMYALNDPEALMTGIARGLSEGDALEGFRLDVIGPRSTLLDDLVSRHDLSSAVVFHGFKPHAEALSMVASADAALLALADLPGMKGVYSGKLFEYLGMGIPVILVGPEDGAAADLVREARAGWVVPAGDAESVASLLVRLADEKRQGVLTIDPDRSAIAGFDRRKQVERVSALLTEAVTSGGPAR